jgi:hypothetical protein
MQKNILQTLLLAVLAGSYAATAGTAESVVDYYKQVQQQLGERELPYRLTKTDAGWKAVLANGQVNIAKLVVDENNGYIYIGEKDTGGDESLGDIELQFTLFRDADQQPAVVFATSHWRDKTPDESHLRMFNKNQGRWDDMTKSSGWTLNSDTHAFPRLSYADFFPNDMTVADVQTMPQLGADNSTVYYQLPQQGTTVKALLYVRNKEVCPATGNTNTAPQKHYCAKLKGKLYTNIELPFDKTTGDFILGKKTTPVIDWESLLPWGSTW